MRERQWCGFLRGLVKPASSAGVSFDFSQDALEIEALAKRRLADEYDAAQERGEVSSQRRHPSHVPDENMRAASADLGLTRKDIYEARQIRDAEERCQAFFGLPFPAKAGAGVKPVAAPAFGLAPAAASGLAPAAFFGFFASLLPLGISVPPIFRGNGVRKTGRSARHLFRRLAPHSSFGLRR